MSNWTLDPRRIRAGNGRTLKPLLLNVPCVCVQLWLSRGSPQPFPPLWLTIMLARGSPEPLRPQVAQAPLRPCESPAEGCCPRTVWLSEVMGGGSALSSAVASWQLWLLWETPFPWIPELWREKGGVLAVGGAAASCLYSDCFPGRRERWSYARSTLTTAWCELKARTSNC